MWDWELLKNGSGKHRYDIVSQYGSEDFQYTHAVSYGTQEDEFCLHNHAMYELVYCISGDVVYLAEGVRYALAPNSLLIINPTVPHKLFICSDMPFERHIMYVYYSGSASQMARLITQCQPPLGQKRIGSSYFADVGELQHMLNQMSAAGKSKDDSLRGLIPIFAQALLAELIMIMRDKKPVKYSIGSSRTLDSLVLYLSQNFNQDLSLQQIADSFQLSRDYCNRLFHDAIGMTVMQYITYSRVLHAKQLLADGVPAAEAAALVGYKDYSCFFRAYRKITGRIPSEDHEIAEKVLEIPKP